MKQKLSLSCCLVHRPEVLLLDEPTFGVDPISRRELWLILHEMVAEGVTIVVSTSYLDEAERCDRVALLNEGRVLALDRPQTLQESMDGTMLSLRTDRPRETRDLLRRSALVRGAALFGETVHARLAAGRDAASVVAALTRAGIAVERAQEVEPSLEDLFIHLVGAAASPTPVPRG
jgi:ABC-2 type transport system ATP-binding protein